MAPDGEERGQPELRDFLGVLKRREQQTACRLANEGPGGPLLFQFACSQNWFFLTFGASGQEAGKARRVREAVQILLGHTFDA